MELVERIQLFYTGKGIIGKSMLDLELEALKPFDDAISIYEAQNLFEKELYWVAIGIIEGVYRVMNHQFRLFYDEVKKLKDNELMDELMQYNQYVVTFLTKEIIRRKRAYYQYREKYYTKKVIV